ncbi:NUDIX domain-containing protein [Sinomonas notoginsengisoli]|uniref:NUDIX hydrolase n=1 Tax=Sinomonas notoginsengisoli TaxID=1457311 RepID=UPI0027DF4C52|nr:NUDIX domain-containing protein [Sinomonas notoginsengisoli]
MPERIVVSAVCVFAPDGRLLTVRKRGTGMFMHPGGKPEAGESPAETASRELFEETGIVVPSADLEPLGFWLAHAANEAETDIEATVFVAPGTHNPAEVHPSAEIAELRWIDPAADPAPDLAPLLADHILPLLARGGATR